MFENESETVLMDMISQSKNSNPEDMIINREEMDKMHWQLNKILSAFELKVLSLYLSGESYVKIANILKKDTKSVDNALQRIKRKVEKYLSKEKNEQII